MCLAARSHLLFPSGRTSFFPQVAPPFSPKKQPPFPPRAHLPFPPGRTSLSPQVAPPRTLLPAAPHSSSSLQSPSPLPVPSTPDLHISLILPPPLSPLSSSLPPSSFPPTCPPPPPSSSLPSVLLSPLCPPLSPLSSSLPPVLLPPPCPPLSPLSSSLPLVLLPPPCPPPSPLSSSLPALPLAGLGGVAGAGKWREVHLALNCAHTNPRIPPHPSNPLLLCPSLAHLTCTSPSCPPNSFPHSPFRCPFFLPPGALFLRVPLLLSHSFPTPIPLLHLAELRRCFPFALPLPCRSPLFAVCWAECAVQAAAGQRGAMQGIGHGRGCLHTCCSSSFLPA
ncbi:unnamed protein product [Closterium sp. Naga37s-1]|nr:unnamed protein product [Closterium sp. Naga37s-1]